MAMRMDVFGPGRHTIVTYNIPVLINAIGKLFNERTPFPAEVYFVSMREFADRKWGTPQPIIVRNPNMGLGVALLQGFGTYSFQVKDPQQFVTQLVGHAGHLPHHGYRDPSALDAALQAARPAGRDGGEEQRARTDRPDRRAGRWRARQDAG